MVLASTFMFNWSDASVMSIIFPSFDKMLIRILSAR